MLGKGAIGFFRYRFVHFRRFVVSPSLSKADAVALAQRAAFSAVSLSKQLVLVQLSRIFVHVELFCFCFYLEL